MGTLLRTVIKDSFLGKGKFRASPQSDHFWTEEGRRESISDGGEIEDPDVEWACIVVGGYGRRGSPGDVRGHTPHPSRLAAALLGPRSGLPAGLVTPVSVPSDLPSTALQSSPSRSQIYSCLLSAHGVWEMSQTPGWYASLSLAILCL